MPLSGFESDLDDLTDSECSDDQDDVPLASKHTASSSRRSNKDRDDQARKTLRPPRITHFPTKALYDQIVEGTVDLDPEYQRDVVWPEAKQSGLIDSILYNYYVPPIIFAVYATKDGIERRICIDGKQRLTSIQRFIDGLIPHKDCFRGLKSWYKSQPGQAQRLLSDQQKKSFASKQIVCVEYENLTADQEREIFQRVQLGVPLSPAERMQAITGPWPTFIRSIQREVLGENGFEGYIDWGHARGRDFQCLASIAYLASKYPVLSHPASTQLDRWLQDTNPVPPLLRSRLVSTFRIFVYIARDDKLRGPLQQPNRVSPVEFVMIGLLIFVHSQKLSLKQLSNAIEQLRTDVRAEFIDIRLNTRTLKHMFVFVDKKVVPKHLRSDGKGDTPAATAISQHKSSKRKRLLPSDDDEEDLPILKPRKGKSKKVESSSDSEKPTKPQKQPKSKNSSKDTSRKKPPKPPIVLPIPSQPPAPKPVNPTAITQTAIPIVKPPVPPSRRVVGSTLANSTVKPSSTPVLPSQTTTNPTPTKAELDEPKLTLPKPPVPPPPVRRPSNRFPPPTPNAAPSQVPNNSMASPSPDITLPIVMPPIPPPAFPTSVNAPSPAAAPVVPALPSPPPQTQVPVKQEPSPLETALRFDHERPTSLSNRLAPLRAARAAVSSTTVDSPMVGSQPLPSPTLPLPSFIPSRSASVSLATQDPRRRPMPPKLQQPPQQPTTAMRNNIEDFLLRGSLRNPSSESISPPTVPPSSAGQWAIQSLHLLSNPGVGVNANTTNVQINGAASGGTDTAPVPANHTTVHNSLLAQAGLSRDPSAPYAQNSTPLSAYPQSHASGVVSYHAPSTGAPNTNQDVSAPTTGLLAIAAKPLMTLNDTFPDHNLASLPPRPRSQSTASNSISGVTSAGWESLDASLHSHGRGRDRYRDRDRDLELDSRYGSHRRSRRDSHDSERDGYHRWDHKYRDRGYSSRGQSGSWDRDRDRERYREQESGRGYDYSPRNSGGGYRDRRRET